MTKKNILKKYLFLLLCLNSLLAFSQEIEVSGIVKDPQGVPLPGVSVQVKDSQNGTATNFDGRFTLEVPNAQSILVFTYIGFEQQEISVGSSTNFDVTLQEDVEGLSEVVVVGYGTQEKVSMTSAVSSIEGEEVVQRSSRNLESSLQGLAPGLTVWDRGGAPGSSSISMNIRGVTTLGGNNPLVIVDGIEQTLNNVDPNNIQSISILKDAASTAIYGSRGANGVILVTTKRGKAGEYRIRYNVSLDLQNLTIKPDHLGTREYLELQNVAFTNRGADPLYTEEEINKYVSGEDRLNYPLPNTWFDVIPQENAPMQRHSLSISGGTEKLTSNLMINYHDQQGIYDNQDSQKYSIRLNNDINLTENLLLKADLNFDRKDRYTFRNADNMYHRMLHSSQFTVPMYPDGTYGLSPQKHSPLAWSDPEIVGATDATSDVGVINMEASWEIIDGLRLTSQYAVNVYKYSSLTNIPTYEIIDYFNPDRVLKRNEVNELSENRSEYMETTWNNTLTYDMEIQDHKLGFLAGYSEIRNDAKSFSANGKNFYNNDLLDLGLGDPLNRELGSSYTDWGLRSLFGRANYSFMNKYIVEFNMRYDGSSRFPEGNRYTFFPSVAGAWRISEENFFQPLKPTINELKVRASWGETGNQNVGLYSYFESLYLSNYYVFNNVPVTGVRQTNSASTDLTWETTTQTNIGLDLAMFRNRITATFDWH